MRFLLLPALFILAGSSSSNVLEDSASLLGLVSGSSDLSFVFSFDQVDCATALPLFQSVVGKVL